MKTIIRFTLIIAIGLGFLHCQSKSNNKTVSNEKTCCANKAEVNNETCCSKVNSKQNSCCSTPSITEEGARVVYFHATRRCATCKAVENLTSEIINTKFKDKATFTSINREEDKGNPLISKYKVNGQTLIITNGDSIINFTNYAFLNAKNDPEKYQTKLVSVIESMLK